MMQKYYKKSTCKNYMKNHYTNTHNAKNYRASITIDYNARIMQDAYNTKNYFVRILQTIMM